MGYSDFYSPEIVFDSVKKMEEELKALYFSICYKLGNRYLDDVIQDTYIKCVQLLTNSPLMISEFKREVKQICTDICFEYYWSEKQNPSKPIKELPKNWSEESGGWGSMGADFLFELPYTAVENKGLNKLIAFEELEQVIEYKKKWLSFKNAKEYISHLKLQNKTEWEEYCRIGNKPKNIPENPDIIYKKWFTTWENWLSKYFFTYTESKNWVSHNLQIKDIKDWDKIITKIPPQIPAHPNIYYASDSWVSWEDFLSINPSNDNKQYWSYKKSMDWIENNLWEYRLTESLWIQYVNGLMVNLPKLPIEIPQHPNIVYLNNGWISWFHWLSSGKYYIKKYPSSYKTVSKWMQDHAPYIKTKENYKSFANGDYKLKKPNWIPDNPEIAYRNRGFVTWNLFLGVNGYNKNSLDNLFLVEKIKIKYNDEHIWVKPISIFSETITAITLTIFSNVGKDKQIQFNVNDVISINYKGVDKTKYYFKSLQNV